MHQRNIPSLLLLAVIALCPFLEGAGCSSHYSGNLKGTVAVAPSLVTAHEGQNVKVLYRVLEEGAAPCNTDWDACLGDLEGWQPLKKCDAIETSGQQPMFVVTEGAGSQFDACTHMVGIYYKADVIAFIDADGDGVLDSGERWGGFEEGPVARGEHEASIRITIPPAP